MCVLQQRSTNSMPTIMFTAKFLLVLASVTVLFLRGEAAGAVCGQRSPFSTIQALPGKPGKNGAPGVPGPKGEAGMNGTDGEQGPQGPQGPVGSVGPKGIAGMKGTNGEQGIAGMNGTDGEQGPQGPQGPVGSVGPKGIAGMKGTNGEQGIAGMNGTDGEQGPVGPEGPVGPPGLDGRNGSDGRPGPPGTVPDSVIEQLRQEILEEVMKLLPCLANSENNPATSCKKIYDCNPTAPSGYYWVNTTTGPLQVYCQMETNNCGNITGGWMRAAYIDMTNVSNTCPQGLTYTNASSTRMCTRSHNGSYSCSSVTFPTHGVPYTKVCGRARGYQFFHTYSFYSYSNGSQTTLDSSYVSGLSVTYGIPRNHIWTFAAGVSKDYNHSCCNCPCAPYPGPAAPPFVGENYVCESGNTGGLEYQWYVTDPLWDSQGCASGSTCCDRGGPWFTTTLNQEVSNDIEVRMCHTNTTSDLSDIGVDQLEIFIY